MKPEKTKQAWRDALDRGADPGHIVKAAKAYAYARQNEDQQFTPYSNTWLDAGSYDDPIDTPPPSGPHRNPEDDSDYHQGWD
jgi:hypothetical protein